MDTDPSTPARIDTTREFQPVCVGTDNDISSEEIDREIAEEIRRFTTGAKTDRTAEKHAHLHGVVKSLLTPQQYEKAVRRAEYAVQIARNVSAQLSESPPTDTMLTSLLPGYDLTSALFIVEMAALSVDIVENTTLSDRPAENTTLSVDIVENTALSVDIVENTTLSDRPAENTTLSVDIVENTTLSVDIVENTTLSVDIVENTTLSVDIVENTTLSDRLAENTTLSDRLAENTTLSDRLAENTTLPDRLAENTTLPDRLAEKIIYLDVDIALNAVRERDSDTDDLDLYVYLYRCIADSCTMVEGADTSQLYTAAAQKLKTTTSP